MRKGLDVIILWKMKESKAVGETVAAVIVVMICRTPGVYWIFSKKTKERTKRSGCGRNRNGEKGMQKRGKGD